jgi:hypothetical protein
VIKGKWQGEHELMGVRSSLKRGRPYKVMRLSTLHVQSVSISERTYLLHLRHSRGFRSPSCVVKDKSVAEASTEGDRVMASMW